MSKPYRDGKINIALLKGKTEMDEKITAKGISKNLCAPVDIEVYDELDSTNTVARERLLSGCAPWHTVIACRQTGGEGRLGRSFFSPCDTGIYMSCVLYPDSKAIGLITGMAAVCVCEALEELGLSPSIKWVNDIFVNGKKVCGILAKSVCIGERIGVILGIGINVYEPTEGFPEELCGIAGFLLSERKEGLREKICARILERLMERYESVGEDDAPLQYRLRCMTVGKKVTVIPTGVQDKAWEAYALCVTDEYHLIVRKEDGAEEELSSGEVSVRL